MNRSAPKHAAWKLIFEGLDGIPMEEIQKVLGVSMLTAGRLSVMAGEYNRDARHAQDDERYGTVRPKTLPKFYPTEEGEDHGVR